MSELVIPSNIEVIKKNAFKNCKKLKKIVFEGAVPQIAPDAFEGCSSIKVISAPNGSIENCNLTGLEHAIVTGFFELITSGNMLAAHVIQGGNNYIKKHPKSVEELEDNIPVLTYLVQNQLLSQQMATDIMDKAWLLDRQEIITLLQDYSAPKKALNSSDAVITKTFDKTLQGKTFVVTGELNNFTRSEIKTFIEEHGGKLSGSVSSKTDFLITNTPYSGTTKNQTARSLNIPVITEDDFLKMVK